MRPSRASRDRIGQRADVVITRRARPVHPVVLQIAENLADIDVIRIVRISPGFLQASSETGGARKTPVTTIGHPTAVGVSLILEPDREEIQFFEITSAVKGYGSRMVDAIMNALPERWLAAVLMDWSYGFWQVMEKRYRQIILS